MGPTCRRWKNKTKQNKQQLEIEPPVQADSQVYSYSFQTRQNCLICRLLFIIIDTKNSNCMQGSLNKTLQAQFTGVFIVWIDV